ncbi:unnamed protein product [Echinostoma caproni]|uniref:Calglandulin n=1 Tax=Echinostoma caproni TaxID=27848 RepID=A0A183AWE3_9TREM|nr:unnamed protein product [Echinostoma caproni]
MAGLSDADRQRIAALFSELDVDKDGRVSVAELTRVIRGASESEKHHEETAKRIISRGTKNEANRSTLTFNEFLAYIKDTETQLRLAFRQLDRNQDSVVDAEEIRSAMKDLGVHISLDDAKKLLGRMDKDGSLNIDFEEWRNFLLFSGTSRIDEIFQYWKRASAIDIGEDMLVPDDFTEEEKKSGQAWKTLVAGGELIFHII